jgi:hypothetical protein
MSALGRKRTFGIVQAMSALLVPKADTTLHLIRLAPAIKRQGSNGLPYRIVQIGTWPGPYSFPVHGVPQMCR